MLRRTRHLTLQFESLESKLLLSTTRVMSPKAHAALVRRASTVVQPLAVQTQGVPPTGPMLPTATIQAFQSLDSGLHLEAMLSQVAYVVTNRSDIQTLASTVLVGNQTLDNQGHVVAQANNILEPSGLLGSDQTIAKSALQNSNRSNLDSAYLQGLIQVDQQIITRAGLLNPTTTGNAIQQYASSVITTAQSNQAQAQALLNNLGTSSPPVTNTGSTSPPITSDATYMQANYEGNQFEWLMAQVAALASKNSKVQSYANKLVDDHYHGIQQDMTVASSLGLSLQPGISGEDQKVARQILTAINTSRFNTTYLSRMVTTHTTDMQENKTILRITQNPNVQQLAQSDLPTDFLHRLGAYELLKHFRRG